MSGFSAFVLTTTGSNILFRSNPKRQSKWKLPVQQLSIFVTGRGGNSMTHRVMAAAVKLHLNATYAQHLALKSVYDDVKRQGSSIICVVSYFPLRQYA